MLKAFIKSSIFSVFILFFANFTYSIDSLTIQQVLNTSKNNDTVIIEGKIIKQIDKDEFILQDSTGNIQIELDDDILKLQNINFPPLNSSVKIMGIVDKELLESTTVEVTQIKFLNTPVNPLN